jgi:anti-sigma regulatory factor (Ser/Thr protein kinase)
MNLIENPYGPVRSMNDHNANAECESLTLESELSEIARVPPWIEKLASLHAIPDRIQYAMDLCLEEALSNVIRHGYAGESNHAITVRCEPHRDGLITLVVEDDAPPFNPLLVREPPLPRSLGDIARGGQGIHLLKQFADAVEYERKPAGNRLTISFFRAGSSRAVSPALPA